MTQILVELSEPTSTPHTLQRMFRHVLNVVYDLMKL